jgi:hypothetical protein
MDMFSSSDNWIVSIPSKLGALDQGVISLRDKLTRCQSTIFTGDVKGLGFRRYVFIFYLFGTLHNGESPNTKIVSTLPVIMLTKRQSPVFRLYGKLNVLKPTGYVMH